MLSSASASAASPSPSSPGIQGLPASYSDEDENRVLCGGIVDWKKDGILLTAEQKQFYEKNGYLVVKNCVSQRDCEQFRARFLEICNAPRGTFPNITVMRDISWVKEDQERELKNIYKIQDWMDDPVLFSYCKNQTIVDVLKDLMGTPESNMVAMHTMLINKCPDNGTQSSRHPLHQDSHFMTFRPTDFICCAWTAMQTINRTNGCLAVVPGTHKGRIHEHSYPDWGGNVNKAHYGISDFDTSLPIRHIEMEAGDTIFFHPTLIHGSGANKSDGYRLSISCHFANGDLCKYVPPESTTPEHFREEIMTMFRAKFKKMGFDETKKKMELTDVWRFRARPVNGSRANL